MKDLNSKQTKTSKPAKQTNGRRLERFFKGPANHRRIDILLFVEKNEGISLEGISDGLETEYKTIAAHTEKLVQAGLVNKKNVGKAVAHQLSPYGKRFAKFINTF